MGAMIGELIIKPAIKAAIMFCVMEGLRRLVRKKERTMPMAPVQAV